MNCSGLTSSQARKNLFFANDIFSNAIYSEAGASNIFVDSNRFNGAHNAASINFAAASPQTPQSNIIISNNVMFNDNSIALTNTSNVKIVANAMFNTQGSSIFLAGGTDRTEIEDTAALAAGAAGQAVADALLRQAQTVKQEITARLISAVRSVSTASSALRTHDVRRAEHELREARDDIRSAQRRVNRLPSL